MIKTEGNQMKKKKVPKKKEKAKPGGAKVKLNVSVGGNPMLNKREKKNSG